MATPLRSNTLLLVNLSDGAVPDVPDYYVHIRYSNNSDGSGELSETPLAYIGIYVGTEAVAPSDYTLYTWSKYGGESTYIDIRYSNDGETFTENNGLDQGSWIGFYITDDPQVLEPDYIPIWENYEPWTKLETTTISQVPVIETDYNNIYKFLTSDGKYTYSPATISISLKTFSLQTTDQLLGNISYYYTYLEEDGTINDSMSQTPTIINNNIYNLSLNDGTFANKNLQHIILQAVVDGKVLISKVMQVSYGTSENMAKLSLNAADIVAAIENTKLIFNTDGLTIKNGGLAIYNNNNDRVFYVDDNSGDLYFSGELHSDVGTLGGWLINENGLYSLNEEVGLYSGGSLIHPNDTNNIPIRFWAGKYEEDEQINYHFAVNHEGTLFANQAKIEGKIIATEGYIKNRFFIGSEDQGIIIYGGDTNNQSFIGSSLYSSGALGYGWKLLEDGTAEFNNIIARGKIQSSVFEYNKISSVGGSLYIAPTIYIETESQIINTIINSDTDSTIIFSVAWDLPYSSLEDLNGRDWNIGDEVKLDGDILTDTNLLELSNLDGVISNIETNDSGTFTTLTVNFTTSKYTQQQLINQYFQPGAILILYGSEERRHGLYLTAAGANSPYMDVYDDSEDNTVKPAVRIGNLNGINDTNFPDKVLSGYGLYSSNAYLRGQLMLPGAGITNQSSITYGEGDATSPIRIWAGINDTGDNITNANFIVTANGYMYAKQGIFEGTVKATNSEFSGTIKAAGIVIDEGSTGYNPSVQTDHFFVAYTDQPSTFNDYVLDIGSHGLSIWEGGLRAYSDYASELNNTTNAHQIYGYSDIYTNPLPYFSLADDGDNNTLNARIIAYKGHFLTVEKDIDKYNTNSIIINNGLQFATGTFSNKTNIEYSSFYNSSKIASIELDNNLLTLNDDNGLVISSNATIFINPNKNSDFNTNHAESMFIRGQIKLVNDISDNLISLNIQNIKEAKDKDNNSIGIDIIIT